MSINVLISGCKGQMGKILCELIDERMDMNIVAGIDKLNNDSEGFPIYNNFNKITNTVDVIIDFSNRIILNDLLDYVIKNQVAIVLCTTGYTKEDEANIRIASQQIPVFRSQNMSYGINVIKKQLESFVKSLEMEYNIEIIESHHNLKQDSPSGTAKMLLGTIKENMNYETEEVYGRCGNKTKRKDNEIGIHSIRGGTIPGEHTILFAGDDENIEIKHTALSKKIFARGAIKAAKYITGCEPGLYNMDNLINNNK